MKTYTLSGFIEFIYTDDWEHIYLVQSDKLKIDLVFRLAEIKNSFPDKKCQVSFYLSKSETTKEAANEKFIEHLYGAIESAYENNGKMYSEWTGYVESYNTELSIGGHSFDRELKSHIGKFIIIDFNLTDS